METETLQLLAKVDKHQKADAAAALKLFKAKVIPAIEIQDHIPTSYEDLEIGSARAKLVAKISVDMKQRCLEMTKPFRDGADNLRIWWKAPTDAMDTIVRKIRVNNKVFTDAEAAKKVEEAAAAARVEAGRVAAQKKREAAGMKVKPIEDLAPVARPISVRAETSVTMVATHFCELTEFFKVPAQYLKPDWQQAALDTVKIKSAQAAHRKLCKQAEKDGTEPPGPLLIPGLKVWSEDRPL